MTVQIGEAVKEGNKLRHFSLNKASSVPFFSKVGYYAEDEGVEISMVMHVYHAVRQTHIVTAVRIDDSEKRRCWFRLVWILQFQYFLVYQTFEKPSLRWRRETPVELLNECIDLSACAVSADLFGVRKRMALSSSETLAW